MKANLVYVTTAYHWYATRPDLERAYGINSYLVGARTKKAAAISDAEAEEADRDGKYGCQVVEVDLNLPRDAPGQKKVVRECKWREDLPKA